MVTLVHDQVPVIAREIINHTLSDHALYHR
jgi:hypothetical protein